MVGLGGQGHLTSEGTEFADYRPGSRRVKAGETVGDSGLRRWFRYKGTVPAVWTGRHSRTPLAARAAQRQNTAAATTVRGQQAARTPGDQESDIVRQAFERFLGACTGNLISLVGTCLTTASAFLFVLLMSIHTMSERAGGPYLGILTFLILPGLLMGGLLLIPLGIHRMRVRRRRSGTPEPAPFVTLDFNNPATRRTTLVFLSLTIVNALILGMGTYKGVEVMDSTQFCGTACHKVMEPEYTTYQRSPHARVKCAECHIGAGADWFVKSKLSGSWQVVSVAFNLYPRPIKVPIHSLRPARETCEQCHWPEKFVGDRLKVITHHADDEANTPLTTALVLRVGGAQPGRSHGIHWHVSRNVNVRYRSDESRQTIYEVELAEPGKPPRRFLGPAAKTPEAERATDWRTMDCVDCHNRPTHVYRMPDQELDSALEEGRIDASLPFIRREGMKVLQVAYPSHEVARSQIAQAIVDYYRQNHAQLADAKATAIAAAGQELGNIWCWNVFPQMNVTWGTYRSHIGHLDMGPNGCFRCHGGEHVNTEGEAIPGDCNTCHSILAQDEQDPAVLKTLLD